MIRDKAKAYGVKYTSRAIDKIQEAQTVSERAGQLANRNLSALDELNKIDRELVGNVNSANAAFDRLSLFFNTDRNTVGTTFLLTRATQLELIGILAAIFVIFIPAAPKKQKHKPVQKKAKADTEVQRAAESSQRANQVPSNYSPSGAISASVSSPKSTVSGVGRTEIQLNTEVSDTETKSAYSPSGSFGMPSASKKTGRPLSIPMQKETEATQKTDTELYSQFVSHCKSGRFKGVKSDFAATQYKKWISSAAGVSNGKAQALGKEWLDKAGNAGEFEQDKRWKEGSTINRWRIK